MFDFMKRKNDRIEPTITAPEPAPFVIDVNDLPSALGLGGIGSQSFDGEKFPGGFGETQIYTADYWTLRARSGQLFRDNLYGRGLILRLITNEINTGLTLDCIPSLSLIPDIDEANLMAWVENVEARWAVFAKSSAICDFQGVKTEGQLQRLIRQEALIDGDILIVQRFNERSGQTATQLIRSEFIQTPIGGGRPANGNRIDNGVELDSEGRHVAYWVMQDGDDKFKRLPARARRTGRRVAWMLYGTNLRNGDVRGEPLLGVVMQSLKEIDRYRDAASRKAVINSLIAMYVTKDTAKIGSRPLTAGAVRRDTVATGGNASDKKVLNVNALLPGTVVEELQPGEDIKAFRPDGTDINFGGFEASIIQAIAWANQMPPEILTLSFSSNYSASQAAINEFKMYLNLARSDFSNQYCIPRYMEWLHNELLAGKIEVPGLLEAWGDPRQHTLVGAWTMSDWTGAIKPSTDLLKQARGYRMLIDDGLITRERAAVEINGTNWALNARKLKGEAKVMAAIREILPPAPETSSRDFGTSEELTVANTAKK